MRALLVDVCSLLCAVAGWFYLFYSQAASRLRAMECPSTNARRVTLRRFCGAAMVLLGILLFTAFNYGDGDLSPRAFAAVWLGVMLLLLMILILVYVDMRLTWKLRRAMRSHGDHPRS